MNPISLIICIRNEELVLNQLLLSLNPLPADEIVFVLDRCTDKSKSIIEEFPLKCNKKVIEIKESLWPTAPKKYAVYQGVINSSNELLLFTDADCVLFQNHFSINRLLFEKNEIIIGFCIPENAPTSFLEKLQFVHFLWTASVYSLFTKLKHPYMVMGANWGYKKYLFKPELLQKHSDIKSGDDDLFFQELLSNNPKIVLNEFTNVSTQYSKSWSELIRQKLRHLKAGTKYKAKFLIILGFLNLFELVLLFSVILSLVFFNFMTSVYLMITLSFYYILILKSNESFNKRNKLNHLSIVSVVMIKPVHTFFITILSVFSILLNPKWKS